MHLSDTKHNLHMALFVVFGQRYLVVIMVKYDSNPFDKLSTQS